MILVFNVYDHIRKAGKDTGREGRVMWPGVSLSKGPHRVRMLSKLSNVPLFLHDGPLRPLRTKKVKGCQNPRIQGDGTASRRRLRPHPSSNPDSVFLLVGGLPQRLSTLPPLALAPAASRVPSRLLKTRSSGLGVSKPNATAARGIRSLFSSRERSPIPMLDAILETPVKVDGADIRSRDPKAVGSGFTQTLTRLPGVVACVEFGRVPKSGSSSKTSCPESISIAAWVVGEERSLFGRMAAEAVGLDDGPDESPLAICAFSANFDTGLASPGVAAFGTERTDGDWGFEVVF